jgi:hypothetical protein
MKAIRAKYYDKADPETRRAWRVKGGLSNVNRNVFSKEKAREAANKRWHGQKGAKDGVPKSPVTEV